MNVSTLLLEWGSLVKSFLSTKRKIGYIFVRRNFELRQIFLTIQHYLLSLAFSIYSRGVFQKYDFCFGLVLIYQANNSENWRKNDNKHSLSNKDSKRFVCCDKH